jgi:hypothetical protein
MIKKFTDVSILAKNWKTDGAPFVLRWLIPLGQHALIQAERQDCLHKLAETMEEQREKKKKKNQSTTRSGGNLMWGLRTPPAAADEMQVQSV